MFKLSTHLAHAGLKRHALTGPIKGTRLFLVRSSWQHRSFPVINVTMNDKLFPPLTALAAARDDAARARLLRSGGLALLAHPNAVASVAAVAVAPESSLARDAQALLSAALDEARMAVENDVPEGAALIGALAAALMTRDATEPFPPGLRLTLAKVYASAGLVPPTFATLRDGPIFDDSVAGMPDLDALLGPVLREFGDAPAQAHGALSEMLAGLPAEPAAALVSMIVARPGPLEARLGLYWLLDPRPELRLAAATALLSRAVAGALPPDLAALLPTLRKWLPEDGARAAIDAAIRRQMRDGIARPAPDNVIIHRAAASLPDGAGAQSLIASVQIGSRRAVALAMLKQGHGVKDAFLLPCASASEQKRLLARVLDEIETHDLPPEALSVALARGLEEGLALGRLPAPGMVDMAEIWGPEALLPTGSGAGDILSAIGASQVLGKLSLSQSRALVQASEDWPERFDHLDSWFEDSGPLRDAIGRARTETGQAAAVWKHLETRRDWWARIFASSAAVLQDAGDPVWLSFAAVAQALIDGTSLKRLPIMTEIVDMTLEAWESRLGDGPGPRSGPSGDIDGMLAQAGISAPFLHGYLVALAISPRAPRPEAWLGPLLGGIEFPGEGSVNRVMEVVVARANSIDDEAGNAEAMAEILRALDGEDMKDWATGFDALLSAAPRAWPIKALTADDKRMLSALTKVAKGSEDSVLLGVLPPWIARRHARRE
jgi:hypothetical protein